MKTTQPGERSMLSRLVLFGIVGALGITIPSQKEIGRCFGAAQSWAIARLADWDSPARRQERYHYHHRIATPLDGGPSANPTGVQLALGEIKRRAQDQTGPSQPVVTLQNLPAEVFAPSAPPPPAISIVKSAEPAPKRELPPALVPAEAPVAFDFGSMEDVLCVGRDWPPETVESAGPPPAASEVMPHHLISSTITGWSDDLDAGLFLELGRLAEEVLAMRPSALDVAAADHSAGCFEDSEEELLAFDQSAVTPSEQVSRNAANQAVRPAMRSGWWVTGFGWLPNLAASEFRVASSSAPAGARPIPAKFDFEPMQIADGPPAGLAYELNRAAEGIDLVVAPFSGAAVKRSSSAPAPKRPQAAIASNTAPVSQKPSEPRAVHPAVTLVSSQKSNSASDPELGRAFRLTRDALLAWMNVLTGKPLVKVTTR
jgi:hypothetical protein